MYKKILSKPLKNNFLAKSFFDMPEKKSVYPVTKLQNLHISVFNMFILKIPPSHRQTTLLITRGLVCHPAYYDMRDMSGKKNPRVRFPGAGIFE
jgi:hypothetical protein